MTTANDDIRERISRIEAVIPTLATKEDLESLRGEMRTDNERLRTDNERLRTEMERLKFALITTMIALFSATVAAMAIIIRFVA